MSHVKFFVFLSLFSFGQGVLGASSASSSVHPDDCFCDACAELCLKQLSLKQTQYICHWPNECPCISCCPDVFDADDEGEMKLILFDSASASEAAEGPGADASDAEQKKVSPVSVLGQGGVTASSTKSSTRVKRKTALKSYECIETTDSIRKSRRAFRASSDPIYLLKNRKALITRYLKKRDARLKLWRKVRKNGLANFKMGGYPSRENVANARPRENGLFVKPSKK